VLQGSYFLISFSCSWIGSRVIFGRWENSSRQHLLSLICLSVWFPRVFTVLSWSSSWFLVRSYSGSWFSGWFLSHLVFLHWGKLLRLGDSPVDFYLAVWSRSRSLRPWIYLPGLSATSFLPPESQLLVAFDLCAKIKSCGRVFSLRSLRLARVLSAHQEPSAHAGLLLPLLSARSTPVCCRLYVSPMWFCGGRSARIPLSFLSCPGLCFLVWPARSA
jgi:hypothetical protein